MSEQRFKLQHINDLTDQEYMRLKKITDNGELITLGEVVDLLNEQQDTIFKLQDLCGKSDGENAKLRIENNELQEEIKLLKPTNVEQYEQIVQLQEENEKLRKELNDCEKFRYQVFKRMNEEYIKECSIR